MDPRQVLGEDLLTLSSKLKRQLPDSARVYNLIKKYLDGRWPHIEVWVDQWPAYTAILVKNKSTAPAAFAIIHVVFGESNGLKSLLSFPNAVHWTSAPFFEAVRENNVDVVYSLIEQNGGKVKKFQQAIEFFMDDQAKINIREPGGGMVLRRLKSTHEQMLADEWTSGRVFGLDRANQVADVVIRCFPNNCLYDRQGDVVGYVGCYPSGFAGMLQVHKDHRRKGYGRYLLRRQIEEMKECGLFPVSIVMAYNEASIKLHTLVGMCEKPENVYHMEYLTS